MILFSCHKRKQKRRNHNGKYVKLRIFLLENGIKDKDVAKLIGVNASTFSKKINNKKTDFNLKEVRKIESVKKFL